jgi:hypothetical protein
MLRVRILYVVRLVRAEISVLGPTLLVSGGFYDGKSTIVEPLVHFGMMLHDLLYERQEDLARLLLALKQGIDTISRWVHATGTSPLPSYGRPLSA